jgi:GST-like protein
LIDLYTWPTPNGHKIHIMLEETGLEYRVHPIDIGAGEQFKPDFLAISPNNKIPRWSTSAVPAASRSRSPSRARCCSTSPPRPGKFLPADVRERWEVMQWVMFQMGHIGPMLGQAHHFCSTRPEKIEYAMNRYRNEAKRLYGVLTKQVGKHEWIAGGDTASPTCRSCRGCASPSARA